MIRALLLILRIKEKYTEDEISVYAAQASFFIVLSAVPFIMVLLSAIQLIPAVSKADLLTALIAILPETLKAAIFSIINDLFTRFYGYHGRRGYLLSRLICTGYTVLFVAACVLSLTLLVFGTTLQALVVRLFPVLAEITLYIISFRQLLSLTILTLIFAGLYTFIPDKKQKISSQLPGAIFSTVCWMGFSFAFSIYFDNFSNYSYMYGSLTAIVLLMLWLYFCICILFLGAEINYFWEKGRGEDPEDIP